MAGRVRQILVGADAGSGLRPLASAMFDAGRGVVGNRYNFSKGTFSSKLAGTPAIEATLIEQEEIDAFHATSGRNDSGQNFRRNIVTEGVRLAELIGKVCRVGSATLRGIRFCEPCAYLPGMLGPEIMQHMVHKAGIRAQIVDGGIIRVSDTVED